MAKQKGTPKQWQEKVCPRCGTHLTEDNHNPLTINSSNYVCKDCMKKSYQKNKEKLKKRSKANYQKNKERYRLYYQKNKEKKREYYQKNKEKIRAAKRENYQKNKLDYKKLRVGKRKRVLEMLGGKCVYCGCDLYKVLEINHINGVGKKRIPSNVLVGYILNGKANISKLEVTCKICNLWHYLTKLKKLPDRWTISWE